MTVEIEFSPRGAKDAVDCTIWWLTHHTQNPNAFDDELQRTLLFIKQFPEASPRGQLKRYRTARVRVMTDTGHLIVYRIKSKSLVEIAAVLVSKKTAARP